MNQAEASSKPQRYLKTQTSYAHFILAKPESFNVIILGLLISALVRVRLLLLLLLAKWRL